MLEMPQYQLIGVNQALYSDFKIIFEIRSVSGCTVRMPAQDVIENDFILNSMSSEDVKRIQYFANIIKQPVVDVE